ncbi:MAG: hypothetical protein QGH42_10490 [Kiritimatiellia bacterium]|nr:hypothetical protein [Kiritimatiellia bacterium]MDP6631450.1 hypothetical protein [Kiritimatiellia bacterium]MDP6811466.1 hypothetical protein [Kiritimatiellia bacterium]MDP7024650.1 hypothetical protein [Kiritimatiellia bacterium]
MTKRPPALQRLLAIPLIALTAGCASRMVGSGPHPIATLSESEPAMVYYLAKDVLHVRGTAHYVRSGNVTIQDVTRRDKKGKKIVEPCFVVSSVGPEFVRSDVTFNFVPTVDSKAFYRLDTRPGWFRKNTQALGLTPSGVLGSVDALGEGKAGVALGALSRVAASAATITGALGEPGPIPVPTDKSGALAGLSPREHYFYTVNPSALKQREALSDLAKTRQELLDGQVALASLPADGMAGAVLREKVSAHQKAVETVEQEMATRSSKLRQAMEQCFARTGLTEETSTQKHVARFELSEIPPHDLLPTPTSRIEALEALSEDYPKMAECLKELRILLTIDGALPAPSNPADLEPEECSAIFYRMPFPGVLRVYRHGQDASTTGDDAARELQLTEIRDVSLLHSDMPATALPSHPSLWTTRRAQIRLDANHRPKELTWQSGAVGADAAASVAEALADFRKEAVTTADQAAKYHDKMREVRLADLEDDIEELTHKRDRLEARIELQGAVATTDQRNELIAISAQADILKKQAEMEKSRRTIEGGR